MTMNLTDVLSPRAMFEFLAHFLCSGTMYDYKLIVIYLKKIEIECEAGCEADFIALADDGGEGVEHVECGRHHPDFADAPSVDEFLAHIEKQAGISSEFF